MSKQRTDSRVIGKQSADAFTCYLKHIVDGLPNDSARRAFLTQLRRNAGKLLYDYCTEEETLRREKQRNKRVVSDH